MFLPLTACNLKDNSSAESGWVSLTMATATENGETQVSYVATSAAYSAFVYSPISMSAKDSFINFELKATSPIPVRAEVVYGTGDSAETYYTNLVVGTEYSSFSVRASSVKNGQTAGVIRLYPSYNQLSGAGELFIKNLSGSDYYTSSFYSLTAVEKNSGGNNQSEDPTGGNNQSEEENDEPYVPENATYLYEKYSSYFKMGMCAGYDDYNSYSDLNGHYNSFTCENEMKLYEIGQNEGQYNFDKADQMVSWARANGKKVRGHALIWYQGAPDWIKNGSKAQVLEKIHNYCYTVVKHFKDRFGDTVYCWDVVNEAISDNGGAFRNEFYGTCGIDFIKEAFRAARDADANVKLFYNDYNMDDLTKRNAVIRMLRELINDGVPIDGVGMQGHYAISGGNNVYETNVNRVNAAITAFESLAAETNHPLEIHITELDIKNYTNDNTRLANKYRELFEVFRNHRNSITCVTTWGVTDAHSWLNGFNGNGDAYPFLFDRNHNKKPAFNAVFDF